MCCLVVTCRTFFIVTVALTLVVVVIVAKNPSGIGPFHPILLDQFLGISFIFLVFFLRIFLIGWKTLDADVRRTL
jgi:hypothetical protein